MVIMFKILFIIAILVAMFFLWRSLILNDASDNYYPDIEEI